MKRAIWLATLVVLLILLAACTPAPTLTPVPPVATAIGPAATPPVSASAVPATATGVSPTATAVPPTATPAPPTSTPKPKIFVIGMSQQPDTLWPYLSNMYVSTVVQDLLYENLVQANDQGKPIANLVTDVPTLESGLSKFVGDGPDKHLEVTLKLKQGVKDSAGNELTADDVVFTYQLLENENSGAAHDTEDKISSVQKVDKYTAVIKYYSAKEGKAIYDKWQADIKADPKKADELPSWVDNLPQTTANFTNPVIDPLYLYGFPSTSIHSKNALSALVDNDPAKSPKVADITKADYARKPVSFGPYTITDWTSGVSITAKARADYFRGKPKIDTIVFRFVQSKDTLLAQLKAGEIGMITQDAIDVSDSQIIDKIDGVKGYYIAGSTWEHIDWNVRKDPTDLDNLDPARNDKVVRQAFAYCVNRQELVDKIFFGKTQIAHSLWTPIGVGYTDKYDVYKYDADKANKMLDDAGYKMGADGVRAKGKVRLEFKFQSTPSVLRKQVTPIVQDQVKKCGFKLTIDLVDAQTYFSQQGPVKAGTCHLCEFAWVGGIDPGNDAMFNYASWNISPKPKPNGGNNLGFKTTELDTLLLQQLSTLDTAQRVAALDKVQQIMMDQIVSLPLFLRPNTTAVTTKLIGFKPPLTSVGEPWNIYDWDIAP